MQLKSETLSQKRDTGLERLIQLKKLLLLMMLLLDPSDASPCPNMQNSLQEICVLIAVEDSVFCLSAMVDIPFSFR
ncbi:hypothetical protein F2Q70_00041097 [Brassica cretica]|uniref:Uncharacterized protein n=1 Tax=Brassica cretica TaxID=69181 RepID=A0A8S9KAN0_BRACR|nr:hypothetical protein F2Q70_00041097 [Brassica cretica]